MILRACIFDISRATDAGTLNAYRMDAISDETLTTFEKTEICAAIDARFSALNPRHSTTASGGQQAESEFGAPS
jgi:hypothetical protein